MITLHFSKANNSFINFVIASSENKDELIPFLEDTNTNGDVWCLENNHYPLLCNPIIKEFPEPFKHHFVFKILPDIFPDGIDDWIECSKQKIPMTGYDNICDENEYLFQRWYNNNLENISFGSAFTPSEINI